MFLQNLIKIIYNLVIAAFLVFLVSFGISAFYSPPPTAPIYVTPCEVMPLIPKTPNAPLPINTPNCGTSTNYNQLQQEYQDKLNEYKGNIAIISIVSAVVFAGIGILLYYILRQFSTGLLLGSLFTSYYSIIQSVASNNMKLQFVIVLVGFIMTLIVGYILFGFKKKNIAEA